MTTRVAGPMLQLTRASAQMSALSDTPVPWMPRAGAHVVSQVRAVRAITKPCARVRPLGVRRGAAAQYYRDLPIDPLTGLDGISTGYGLVDDGPYLVSPPITEGRNDINMSDKQALRTRQRLYIAGGCE